MEMVDGSRRKMEVRNKTENKKRKKENKKSERFFSQSSMQRLPVYYRVYTVLRKTNIAIKVTLEKSNTSVLYCDSTLSVGVDSLTTNLSEGSNTLIVKS